MPSYKAAFNSFAGKIVNEKEVETLFKEEMELLAPKGLKRLTTPFTVTRDILVVPKRMLDLARAAYAPEMAAKVNTYVPKDKELEAIDASQENIDKKPSQRLPTGEAVANAIGKENVYSDANIAIGCIRIAGGTTIIHAKRTVRAMERAVERSTDYSADLKSGNIVKLPYLKP
jgi:hypothetical protein